LSSVLAESKPGSLAKTVAAMHYGEFMKSRALNRSLKLKIYKSLIRPAVTYGYEAWTLTNRDEQYLRISERRILRKIFGTV
jgi:hypothetical protein